MMPTVNIRGGWESIVEGTAREKLEDVVLPEFLRKQRWFGGKGRRLETIRLLDWGSLRAPEDHVFAVLLLEGERPASAGWWEHTRQLTDTHQPVNAGDSPYKIRCHGDYHLGQVLRVADDYVIIDFEGEPMRTVAERRAKQSPLKDLAGMLRAYHSAAYAGLFAFTGNQPQEFDCLRSWAELWFQWVSAAFLRDYRAGVRDEAFVPADTTAFAELLDAFMLEKNYYELQYELTNRPDWVRIPLRGILAHLRLAGEPAMSPGGVSRRFADEPAACAPG